MKDVANISLNMSSMLGDITALDSNSSITGSDEDNRTKVDEFSEPGTPTKSVKDLDELDKKIKMYGTTTPKIQISLDNNVLSLSPYSSNSNYGDDGVLYSDSDGLSQTSLELKPEKSNVSLDSNSVKEKTSGSGTETPKSRRRLSLRRPGDEKASHSGTPKPRKRLRRKSNKSDGDSERSYRSSVRHSEYPSGSGYSLMPAPGKIFRNLLILEEDLRQQVSQQKALRRKYLTFLAILCSLITSIAHYLFFTDPNNTASGTIRIILQFTLLGLLVTVMLYHLSGEYQKTIVLPRKFLSSTNKGLRQLNVRLVKIKTPLTDNIIGLIREFMLSIATMCLNSLHKVYPSTQGNRNLKLEVFLVSCQAQCQPRVGLTDVKLVLNPRVFNIVIREGWELYRNEFWINEGVRRRNHILAFLNPPPEGAEKNKHIKKERKERRDKRRPTVSSKDKLSEHNLKQLDKIASQESLTAFSSGFNSLENTPSPPTYDI